MKKLVKLPKMHFACSLDGYRQSMMHVEITKTNVTASDAHVLITHSTNIIFSANFIESMPEKFYLHRNVWRELSKPCISITFENNSICQYFDGYRIYYSPTINPSWEYPKWESVIPKKNESESLDSIGMNISLLDKFRKAFFFNSSHQNSKLEFYGKNKAVIITSESMPDSYGIIMPCMIS